LDFSKIFDLSPPSVLRILTCPYVPGSEAYGEPPGELLGTGQKTRGCAVGSDFLPVMFSPICRSPSELMDVMIESARKNCDRTD